MHLQNNKILTRLASVTLALTTAFAAFAAPEFDANLYGDSIINLKEISITAAKQTSDNESSASAATLISRATVEQHNVVNMKDVTSFVPNLLVPDYGSRITSTIYMRGMGARIDQPVVGMIIDNVPLLNKDNYDFDIADIESAQVLRGPQSTMYGRNTMGGVIAIRTLSPMSYEGCRLLLEYGRYNSSRAAVSHYSRLSQAFGIGGNISVHHTDGFFRNLYNGEKCDKENGGRAMIKLAWKPSANFILENTASASITRQGGYAYEYQQTKQISYNDTCFYRRTSVLDGLALKWHSENVELTSSTSYQFIDDNMTIDNDFTPLPYFTLVQAKTEHGVTQDIILRGKALNGRLTWLCGAFGFYKRLRMSAPVTFQDYGISQLITAHWNEMNPSYPIVWADNQFDLHSSFTMPNYGAAIYGEASLTVARFSFIAGLRLDYEKSTLDYNSDCSTGYNVMQVADNGSLQHYADRSIEIHDPGHLSRSFSQLLPKASIVYRFSDITDTRLRLSVAKGYKAGGFNTQMFSDVLQQKLMSMMGIGLQYDIDRIVGYEPETSWNYELGIEATDPSGRISASANIFYIDCRNQQLTVFPDGNSTGRIMENAGKSRSTGVELSLSYSPLPQLMLSAAYGYTNAKFVEFNNGKSDYSGKFIPYAPQNTIFASAAYNIQLKKRALRYISPSLSATGTGKIYWNEENSAAQNLYFRLNASVKLSFNKISLNFWAKNITATQYNTFYFVSVKHEFLQKGKPCQFGATLRVTI